MKVIYPGSFDPVTNGHLDIIKRCSKIFDEVVVAILINPNKKSLFSMDERIEMLRNLLYDYTNVKVEKFSGLLVDFCKENGVNAIVRGIRAVKDYESELQNAHINRHLSKGELETIFITATPEVSFLSSTAIKEIAEFGGDLSDLVPENIVEKIYAKYRGE